MTAATTKKRATKRPMLKNTLGTMSEGDIFEVIRRALATHKARRIAFDYDGQGRATAITFSMLINDDSYDFKLPARFDNVVPRVVESRKQARIKALYDDELRDEAYRVTWANLRDWITAQMALIDSMLVDAEEIFMPFALIDDHATVYEAFKQQRALPRPGDYRITEGKGRER